MKKRFLVLPALLLSAAFARPAHADVITYFDFNNVTTDSQTYFSTPNNNSGGLAASTLTVDPTLSLASGSEDVLVGANSGSQSGTNVNQVVAPSGQNFGLTIFNVNIDNDTGNQGKYIQLKINTSGFQALNLSFATQIAGNGFTSGTLQYSTDGTTYSNYAGAGNPYTPDATYSARSFDLSGITGLNSNANAGFRIVFNGGSGTNSSDFNASNYLDNIVLNGTAVATPEPSTWALMILGIGATLLIMNNRKREVEEKTRVKVKVQR